MELQELLNQIKNAENTPIEKTAAAKSPNPKEKLIAALDDALKSLEPMQKTAQEDSATERLVKMAQNLASSEAEALSKEAELYGAALADGFLARLNSYAASLPEVPVSADEKIAAWKNSFAAGVNDGVNAVFQAVDQMPHEKLAAAKQAFDTGYNEAMHLLETQPDGVEKVSEFLQGYDEANALLQTPAGEEKVAAFIQGYDEANALLQTPDGVEKVAEFLQGYDEAKALLQTPDGVEKVAEFIRGYEDGKALLEKTAAAVANTAYKQTLKAIAQA